MRLRGGRNGCAGALVRRGPFTHPGTGLIQTGPSAGCTSATASSSREFCQGVDRLKAQLDIAATAAVLREKIEKLNKSIEALRSQGAGQLADPQSFGLATILGTGQDTIRIALSVLLALVIESVCCFGLLVLLGGSAPATVTEAILAERVGCWLSERAEPVRGRRSSFAELEADFQRWCRSRGAPGCDANGFARLIGAACLELGLDADQGAVEGLILKPS